MTDRLHVLIAGKHAGELTLARGGRMTFRYDPQWQSNPRAIPLSLSMPLEIGEHRHASISAFIWNLLPDNELVISSWAKRYQVGTGTPFGLIAHVGEECAGAVQFVREDRLEAIEHGDLIELSESEIGERLAALRRDPAVGRRGTDIGQFSLSGAQAKTALRKTASGWALPTGAEPTTHIFKPPRPELAGHVENEHFCLRLAAAAGLVCAESWIEYFDDEPAIVITRYDRIRVGGRWIRLHQEDMCQALGVPPTRKYENQGGPGVARIMELLLGSGEPATDRTRFLQAVVFNYLIGGTDAHAKNYSVLLAPGRFRLAPLYDIASVLPYVDRRRDMRLAMRIAGHYRPEQVLPRHWEVLARQCHYPEDTLLAQVRTLIARLPDLARDTATTIRADGVNHPVLEQLVDAIAARCRQLSERFGEIVL